MWKQYHCRSGCAIIFGRTAWLAHIIVEKNHRNRGIGYFIVNELVNTLKKMQVKSVSLIATELGEPVYLKVGFRFIMDYLYFKREKVWRETSISDNIIPFDKRYQNDLINMDSEISGGKRENLIRMFLNSSKLFVENGRLTGFYLPGLGEGQIFALTETAGTGLMTLKYLTVEKAVLPAENRAGIDFLIHQGFVLSETKGKRMVLGENVPWKPEGYYSRAGGNFG
ncbi:MAG: GNAT family N-acetyltransferase [Bacteroidales bacterium]|nr:GNAT family N-acetyltransferase [Bacteroidales bacterium]